MTDFHYNDVPPQNWLDELHSFNVTRAWEVGLNDTQRINLVGRGHAQLKDWRIALQAQIKKIEGRYDSSNRAKMKKATAPYQILDKLGNDLYKQLHDLDTRVKDGRAVPMGFEFGTRIFGDLPTNRWQFGDQEDEHRWRDYLSVERRYVSLTKEYKVQSRGYNNAKKRVTEAQAELESLRTQYQQKSGWAQIGVRLLIVITIVILCLALGMTAIVVGLGDGLALSDDIFAAVMFLLALIGAMIAFVLARRRRFAIAKLQEELLDTEMILKDITTEAKRQRQYLLPTRQTLKEVKADYEALKATF